LTRRLTCCCSPISCAAFKKLGFSLGIEISGRCEALLVYRRRGRRLPFFPLLNGNYDDEVISLSLSLSPTLLVSFVWLLEMVIRCVFL
jgi:hypothetical protein